MSKDAPVIDWPADQVERRHIDTLIPYARNARTHDEVQVAQIAASIREWGWTMPILIDEEGTLIAGHGRVLAARTLGLEEIPVMVARGWSEAKRAAYVIADNRLAENAGWDENLLRVELEGLIDEGFNISLTGFDLDDLSRIAGDLDRLHELENEEGNDDLTQPNNGENKTLLLQFGKRKVPLTEAELTWLETALDQHVETFGMSSGFVTQTLDVRAWISNRRAAARRLQPALHHREEPGGALP